jgi:hypothetical protein
MNKRISLLLLLSAVLITPGIAMADNLLVNGSFETPIVPPSSTCGPYADCIGYHNGVGDSIGGWLVIGKAGVDSQGNPIPGSPASVLQLGFNYQEPKSMTSTVLNFHPQDGLQSVDLTGEGNQGLDNGIKQTVTTIPGTLYDISFWVGHQDPTADGYALGPAIIGLVINQDAPVLFSNDLSVMNDVAWQMFNYFFTATSDQTTIAFLNETPVGNNFAGLDNVILQSVPEPASLVLLGSGMFGFLGLLRKR